MSVASKLQIKPGRSVCVIAGPEGLTLDLELSQDLGEVDAVIVYCGARADLERLSRRCGSGRPDDDQQ